MGIAQVVVLGSGLDSRPWRLPLPSRVAWYEVDWPECIANKRAQLQTIHAATSQAENGQSSTKHPLKAASWSAVEADIAQPDFLQKIEAAGFQRSIPAVYICEGLFMYLTPDQLDYMLKVPNFPYLHDCVEEISCWLSGNLSMVEIAH